MHPGVKPCGRVHKHAARCYSLHPLSQQRAATLARLRPVLVRTCGTGQWFSREKNSYQGKFLPGQRVALTCRWPIIFPVGMLHLSCR